MNSLVLGIYVLANLATNYYFPIITARDPMVVVSGSNFLTGEFTNGFWAGRTNLMYGATLGPQYTIAQPAGSTLLSVQNSSSNIYDFSVAGNTINTTWKESGSGSLNIKATNNNGISYYSTRLLCDEIKQYGEDLSISCFSNFVAGYLPNKCWTNFMAKTNGRQPKLWGTYVIPPEWPNGTPTLAWSNDCIIYGATGLTAISQCATNMNTNTLRFPHFTALTRRHVVQSGHSFSPLTKIYFCTTSNTLVEARTSDKVQYRTNGFDFSVHFLTADLPDSITPLRCISPDDYFKYYPNTDNYYSGYAYSIPYPLLASHKEGGVSFGQNTGIHLPPISGDSGGPFMLWFDNELFFVGMMIFAGIQVSPNVTGPSTTMQAACDALTTNASLNITNYQLQYRDLSGYTPYP